MGTTMILTGSYEVDTKKGTRVVFYCKDRKGDLSILKDQWNPYCIIQGLTPGHIRNLLEDERVLNVIPVKQKLRSGREVEMHKVEVLAPSNVTELRGWVKDYMTVYRGDVVYYLNYMYEHDIGPFIKSIDLGMKKMLVGSKTKFLPKVNVLSFDIENSIENKERNIFTICTYNNINKESVSFSVMPEGENEEDGNVRRFRFDTEEELLRGFIEYVQYIDPDILMGYNIDEYDWILLEERCKHYDIDMRFGRDSQKLYIRAKKDKEENIRHDIKIPGRISWDIWKAVRKFLKPDSEKLDNVAKQLGIGEKLQEVDSQHIDKYWREDPHLVEDYCMQDAKLAYGIWKDQGYLEKAVALADAAMIPLEDAVEAISSRLIDSMMIRAYTKKGYAIPMHRHLDEEDDNDEKIKGAYVHPMTAGVYNYIGVADFKSLYPSIMMEYNICWTTIADDDESVSDDDCFIIEYTEEGRDGPKRVRHRFVKPYIKKGILPEIIENLMKERSETKKAMMLERENGNKKRARYLDDLQGSIKIIMNSFYGLHASLFYRFTDKRIGESITAFAREAILGVISKVEDMGFNVVGSDTDSALLDFNATSPTEAVRLLNNVCSELSTGYLILEPEKVFNTFFNHGRKKNYFGDIIWQDGNFLSEPELYVRGYGVRRRDRYPLQKRYLERFMKAVTDREDMERFWRTVVDELKNFNPDPADLVITVSVRNEEHYKNPDGMPSVKAVRKLKQKGIPHFDGMRVSYIVTKGKTPQEVEPVLENEEYPIPDLEYYRKSIIRTLAGDKKKPGPSTVWGWDAKSIETGMKKSLLDDFFEGAF